MALLPERGRTPALRRATLPTAVAQYLQGLIPRILPTHQGPKIPALVLEQGAQWGLGKAWKDWQRPPPELAGLVFLGETSVQQGALAHARTFFLPRRPAPLQPPPVGAALQRLPRRPVAEQHVEALDLPIVRVQAS